MTGKVLTHLHAGVPRVLGLDAAAVVAHLAAHDVLDHEGLLANGWNFLDNPEATLPCCSEHGIQKF